MIIEVKFLISIRRLFRNNCQCFAHAVLESACGVNSPTRPAASAAIASSSAGAACPAVAYAHAVLDSACGVNPPTRPAAHASPQSR